MAEVRHFTLGCAQRHDPAVELWFAALPPEPKAIALKWFDQIRSCGPDVLELLHDNQPTACIGNLAFSYVAAFQSHVNVGFYFGTALNDPHRVLVGSGRFMRHAKIQPGLAAPERALQELIAAAYADARARQATGVV